MGSKEEAERLKRKGLSLEQESVKKLKTSEEVPEEAKSPDKVPEERALVKESLSNRQPTSDKEIELWEELKSGSIPTAGSPAAEVPTGSDVVPTTSLVFATATVVTLYRRRKGKEIMVESKTQKKKKVQEQIDAQVARELEEKMAREDQRRSEQTQQRKPWSKKKKRDYYMPVIKSNLGWKVKEFRGMTFEEIEIKFTTVWKYLEDFIPMGSKEEAERLKRKESTEKTNDQEAEEGILYGYDQKQLRVEDFIPMGLKEETKRLKRKGRNLEHEQVKKQKSSEEALEIETSNKEFTEEKIKNMMQLVPVEDVYVQALQVKYPIIN
nr:hypothetical protein [Tanacetum cinerariifolium]